MVYTQNTLEVIRLIAARLTLNDYTNRVLNVVKAKFGLNDKSDALNRFVDIYGEEFVEHEPTDEYVKKILELDKKHARKYERKHMTLRELDDLCDMD